MSLAAVIQTAFLGDVVLTTPLIETLAQRYGPVDVVTTPENTPLVETLPDVETVVVYDKRGQHRGIRGLLAVANALRHRAPEYVFLPHESIRSATLAWLARAPNRIGFAGAPGSWLYTERRGTPAPPAHEADRLCALAGDRGVPPRPRIALTETDRQRSQRALHEAGIMTDYLVLAPGARRLTKRWPHFRSLAEHMAEQTDVVIVGGPADFAVGEGVVGPRHRVANLAGTLSIRESAAVIETARLVVCNDSAALHLAGAVQTPVVAIFGPTDASHGFGPRGTWDTVVGKADLSCRPCSRHGGSRCPLRHHRCMVDLEVATVAEIIHNAWHVEARR